MSLEIPTDPEEPLTQDPPAAPVEEPDDDIVEASLDAKGQKVVPLGTLIDQRKAARTLKAENEALKQKAAQYDQMAPLVQQAQPFLQQLATMTPEQQAAAIASVSRGTAPSRVSGPQPADDQEAAELAEDLGLVDANGSLDIARGRRMLDRLDRRASTRMQQEIAPLRQSTAAQQAAVLREQAKTHTDNAGIPLATPESINEAYSLLPPELAANPNVQAVIIGTAMLIDKSKGRTPQAQARYQYADPLLTEPTGRRGSSGPSAQDRDLMKRLGVSAEDLKITEQLGTGRSISLE
jgi:hypothetical protein